MRHTTIIILLCSIASGPVFAQDEPPLKTVLNQLELTFNPAEEIRCSGPTQGLFMKTGRTVEVLPVAKYSFAKQETVSNVRAGYYSFAEKKPLRLLFQCGLEAGDRAAITGLPADPRGPYRFDPGNQPFAFYVQSANFNPEFSANGETVSTQDTVNRRISRFGTDIHKARIYPYQTKHGVKPDWFVIGWEFSINNDFQDLITVVRGVRLIRPPEKKEKKTPPARPRTTQTITLR